MVELVQPAAEWAAAVLEILGVALIAVLALIALGRAGVELLQRVDPVRIFRDTRRRLIRGILLGLEFLVAADIIHTVAVDLTFESVGVLAVIVLIRTFLSFTLELEMTGKWPWQQSPEEGGA